MDSPIFIWNSYFFPVQKLIQKKVHHKKIKGKINAELYDYKTYSRKRLIIFVCWVDFNELEVYLPVIRFSDTSELFKYGFPVITPSSYVSENYILPVGYLIRGDFN